MNPFQKFVSEHADFSERQEASAGQIKSAVRRTKNLPGAPKVLIFSPHPDDECIIGGLALRLLREAKWNVINVAVTLGSKRERRAARLRELKNACASLGFGLIVPGNQAWNASIPKRGDETARIGGRRSRSSLKF